MTTHRQTGWRNWRRSTKCRKPCSAAVWQAAPPRLVSNRILDLNLVQAMAERVPYPAQIDTTLPGNWIEIRLHLPNGVGVARVLVHAGKLQPKAAEDLVRLVDFLEFGFGFGIPGVAVRVVLHRHLAVRLFQVVRGSAFRHAERGIVILFGHISPHVEAPENRTRAG